MTTSDLKEASGAAIAAIDDLAYVPTPKYREVKARFWEAWRDNPSIELEYISAAAVVQVTGVRAIENKWKTPGFKEWFLNDNSYIHKVAANGERGLEVIQEMMDSHDVSDALRLKAAQASVDAWAKLRDKTAIEKFADKALNEMSSEELDNAIKRLEAKR